MNDQEEQRWLAGNQAYLLANLARVKQALIDYTTGLHGDPAVEPPVDDAEQQDEQAQRIAEETPPPGMLLPPALYRLCTACALSAFERDLLLLCAGVELDPELAALCREAGGRAQPTVALALAALAAPHWSALSTGGTLRRARLIELLPTSGETLASCTLRIEERVLHHLTGISHLDPRLQAVLRPVVPIESGLLPPSLQAAAQQVSDVLDAARHDDSEPPLVWLCGTDARDRRSVAAQACAARGLTLYALRTADLPSGLAERQTLLELWTRELYLSNVTLLISCGENESPDSARAALAFIDRLPDVVLLTGREPLAADDSDRRVLRIDVPRPDWQERAALWHTTLGAAAPDLSLVLDQVAAHFRLGAGSIATAGENALLRAQSGTPVAEALWEACRQQARPRLDDMARRITPAASWDTLVLPDAQRHMLHQIVAQQRQQARVYHRWGMGRGTARGLGVTSLFVGQSGTGKTLASEVLAAELKLDLYHIDLSQLISKYIGETEKNLRRVFDAAEEGGAVLLFDEADALFGKRSEVKDSHDRYANIEVSYLLQRMESYQGVSVLTSNLKSALDSAFLRRIRFIVQFPFPDVQQRAELWRRAFPPDVPLATLSFDKLARLNITGGQIRNVSLAAAFLAADEGQPVAMRHLLHATRSEYQKSERPLNEAELGGWV